MRKSVLLQILISCFALRSYAQENLSLEQFESMALEQNLSIKSAEASVQTAKEEASGIRIPPPQVNIIQMKMASGSGSGFSINQSIPFPTKISNDHDARIAMALAKKEGMHSIEADVRAKAKYVYFRVWEAEQRLLLIEEKARIVENHIKLAKAVARSDSFLKIHVLNAENDLDLLRNELLDAEQFLLEKQIDAAEFINRDHTTFHLVTSKFAPSKIPDLQSLNSPHQLEEKKLELQALKARETEAKSQWLPDLSLQYKQMNESPMIPEYSEFMLGATIPFVYFWQPRAEGKQAAARRLESQYLYEKEVLRVASEISMSWTRAQALKKQLMQFETELLPRAERRKKIVNNVAPRDMESLQDHREAFEAIPNLKLKELEIRGQFEKSIMELEKFKSKVRK